VCIWSRSYMASLILSDFHGQVIAPNHPRSVFPGSLEKTLAFTVFATPHCHGRPLIPPSLIIANNRAVIWMMRCRPHDPSSYHTRPSREAFLSGQGGRDLFFRISEEYMHATIAFLYEGHRILGHLVSCSR